MPVDVSSPEYMVTTRRCLLRLSLLFAVVGLAVFVGSCAYTTTATGRVLLVGAGVLGVASIVCTLIAIKQAGGKSS